MHLVPDHAAGGSAIVPCFIEPAAPCSDAWAAALTSSSPHTLTSTDTGTSPFNTCVALSLYYVLLIWSFIKLLVPFFHQQNNYDCQTKS